MNSFFCKLHFRRKNKKKQKNLKSIRKTNYCILFSTIVVFLIFILSVVALKSSGFFDYDEEGSDDEIKVFNVDASEIVVPNLIDTELEEAKRVFSDTKELRIYVSERKVNDDVKEGNIISQLPEKGTTVARGSPVVVSVSIGKSQRVLPEIKGLTLFQAASRLSKDGFKVKVKEAYNENFPKEVIIGYEGLNSGEYLTYGAEIEVLINRETVSNN